MGLLTSIFLAACGGWPGASDPPTEDVVLHVETTPDGAVEAVFLGRPPEPIEGIAPPLSYGVRSLCFRFRGADACEPFRPTGNLHFTDWSFGVFSPNGQWTVLLQDRFCPYHAIRTEHLRAWLRGERGPDRVVDATAAGLRPSAFVPVCEGMRWEDASTVSFTLGSSTPQRVVVPL
jgi:hypothetical protein